MGRLYLALIFCSFTFLGLSQTKSVDFRVGEQVKGKFEKFLEEKDGALYVLMEKGNKFYLRKFDSQTLMMLEEWEIGDFRHKNRSLKYVSGSVDYEGFYLVWEAYDYTENTSYFVNQLITRQGEKGPIAEIATAEQIDKAGRAEMYISQDSSKVSIFIPPIDKRAPKVFVYDSQWNLLWDAKVEVPIEGKLFKIAQVDLTNNGDLLMVGYSHDNSEQDYELMPSNKYALVKMSANKITTIYGVNQFGKVFHSLNVKPDLLDGYIVTGFYSDAEGQDPYGMFYSKLNETSLKPELEKLQMANAIYSTLEEGLAGVSFVGLNSAKRGFSSVVIKDHSVFANGTFVIVGERDYYNYNSEEGHVFGSIIAAGFNDKGESLWVTVVPKLQASINKNIESYAFLKGEDAIYLMYNDDLRNAERLNNGEETKSALMYGKNFGLLSARISDDGAMKMEAVTSMKKVGIFTTIDEYSPNTNTLIMSTGGYRSKKFKPILLRFE